MGRKTTLLGLLQSGWPLTIEDTEITSWEKAPGGKIVVSAGDENWLLDDQELWVKENGKAVGYDQHGLLTLQLRAAEVA